MNIKFSILLFFIKILHIIGNTLYIDKEMFIKDDFINLDWLKEAVLSNDNIIISNIDLKQNEKIEDYKYTYEVTYEGTPKDTYPEKVERTVIYKKQLKYNFEGNLLKINIDNNSNLKDLIKNVKDNLKNNTVKLDKNIKEVNGKIDVYGYKVYSDEFEYEYIFTDGNGFNKELKFDEYSTDNPIIGFDNKNYLFFSYFQCNNHGIFENSNVKFFTFDFLKNSKINFKKLFKNSTIESSCNMINIGVGIHSNINCDEMFYNCEKINAIFCKYCNLFYGKSIFENCKSLSVFGTSNIDYYLPIKNNMFKNCEKIYFNVTDKINYVFVINEYTKEEDMQDVFFNVSNIYRNKKYPVYLKIEEDTKMNVDLDKIFNNHQLEEIIIEDNGKFTICGTKKLLESGNLKKIKYISKEKNKKDKEYILDLTDNEAIENFKKEKNTDDIIKEFFALPDIISKSIEDFNKKRKEEEEERKKQQDQQNIQQDQQNIQQKQQENNSKSINNVNSKCFLCCLKLCKNCKCCRFK